MPERPDEFQLARVSGPGLEAEVTTSAHDMDDSMDELRLAAREPAPQPISTVLIVDDERELARLVARILGQFGYLCVGCESFREAVPLMHTRHFDAVRGKRRRLEDQLHEPN